MEIVDEILGVMHLPGLTFLETVGAGAAMYFGVALARWAINAATGLLLRARRTAPAPASRRR